MAAIVCLIDFCWAIIVEPFEIHFTCNMTSPAQSHSSIIIDKSVAMH